LTGRTNQVLTQTPGPARGFFGEMQRTGPGHPEGPRPVNQIKQDVERALGRKLASVIEAGEMVGCSGRTIRRMVARGAITGYRLPGSRLLRVDLNELDAKLREVPTAGNAA
jgi:excisionase family DNA binding protein